jgi:hypothetical protein
MGEFPPPVVNDGMGTARAVGCGVVQRVKRWPQPTIPTGGNPWPLVGHREVGYGGPKQRFRQSMATPCQLPYVPGRADLTGMDIGEFEKRPQSYPTKIVYTRLHITCSHLHGAGVPPLKRPSSTPLDTPRHMPPGPYGKGYLRPP